MTMGEVAQSAGEGPMGDQAAGSDDFSAAPGKPTSRREKHPNRPLMRRA
jgi:hypothetical protein